jgi:peptidoglycan/LPS O-acetylase OafA/YrhL
LPTLLLVVLTTVFVSAFLLSSPLGEVQGVARSALATLLISANLYFLKETENYFATNSEFLPLLHTWSLSVEEQCYLVWPAMLVAVQAMSAKSRSPVLWLSVAMGVLVIASAGSAVFLASRDENLAFYLTTARGWELGTGGLLALGLPRLKGVVQRWGLAASVAGVGAIVTGIAFIPADRFSPLLPVAFAVLGTSLIIFGNTVHRNGPIGRFLSLRAMVQVGLVSYAWYLWHWPALSIVRILGLGRPDLLRDFMISISTLVLSFLTLYWYERPLRFRIGHNLPAKWIVTAGCGATVVSLALVVAVGLWARYTPLTAAETALLAAKGHFDAKCLLVVESNETVSPPRCLASADLPRVVLWGDSVADRLSPALQEWAAQRDGKIAVEELSKAACPPILNALPPKSVMSNPYYECRSFNSWVADRLALAGAAGGSGVLLSATWWPRATDLDLRPFGGTAPRLTYDISATTTEESLSILERAMRSTLRDIAGHGLRAVIVLQTPLLITPWGGPLYAPDCLFRRSERECAMPLAVHRQLSNQVNQILTRVAGEFPNVRVFDPTALFCRDERCPARINGIVAYTDEFHISATMARTLSGTLAPYLDWLTEPRP